MFRNKLNMPRVGGNIVRRKKIEEKLLGLSDYKLAFLSAPAGYGKTTAVADYLKRTDIKHAWLSLDEADNDPVRFWKYLVASVSGCLDDKSVARLSVDEELVSSNITAELFIDALENVPERFVLINRWTEEVRDFLIHISFLDRLSGSLCAAVTGNERSTELLKRLSESNSFVIPLDSEDRWFRYHHLFREFLLGRLERESDAVRRGLYGKAGAWFLQNGEITEAVNWLLKAGEYEKAYPYISNYRSKTAQDSDYSLWKKWVESIPERLYATDPTMYVSYSWVSSMENRIDTAEEWSD